MLYLGEIEERPVTGALSGPELGMVVEEVKTEVHKAAGHRRAVYEDMVLRQVPTPGPDEELRSLVVKVVHPVPCLVIEAYRPVYGVSQVDLASHQVLPARRQGILEVSLQRSSIE